MKKFLIFLLTVIIAVTTSLVIVKATNGLNESIYNVFLNEDNLVHTLVEYESKAGKWDNGLEFSVSDSGAVTINGSLSEEDEAATFILGTVKTEKADKYTLSGCKTGSLKTFYIKAEYLDASGNSKTLYADFTDSMTTVDEIPEGTAVTISIVIMPGTSLNNITFKPSLCPGEEAGKF